MDSADASLRFTAGDAAWSTRTASDAVGRSYRTTKDSASTSKRARATLDVYGTSMVVDVCKSPSSGSLAVYVDGRLVRTVSLYRSWSGCGATVSVSGLPRATHQVALVAVANGKRGVVSIDRVRVA